MAYFHKISNMKKRGFMIIFFLWTSIPLCCRAQWSLRVTGNIQWCREKITIDQSAIAVPSYTIRSKYIILPKAGIHVDYQLSRSFSLLSGLVENGKGAKFTDPGSPSGPNKVLYYHSYFYLEVPLFIIVSPELFHVRNLYGGLGPFIGYGLGGWQKAEDAFTHKILTKDKVSFGGKKGRGLKDFDNGINFLVGYRLNKQFSIHFIYQYGLMDIYNGPNTAYNRSIGVGIDYVIK